MELAALAYLRLSYRKDRTGKLIEEKRDGITRQRRDMHELADDHEAHLPESAIFLEDDTSASKRRDDETEWAKLLVAIEEQRPAFLFAAALDRLGRRFADLENLEELCRKTGTVVITKREGDLFGLPYWPVLAALAKMEAINVAIRVMRAQKARREAGKDSIGGNRPYGYKGPDRMTIVDDEKRIILEIVRRILAGQTPNGIASDLNRREVPTARGGVWSSTVVTRIATNPRYAGLQEHKGEVIGKAAWPAIITLAKHEALKAALASRPKQTTRVVEGREVSLLSGLVRCQATLPDGSVCGQTMNANSSGRANTPIYRCSGGRARRESTGRGLRRGCGKVTRGRAIVDDFVVTEILGHVTDTIIEDERRAIQAKLDPMELESTELMIKIGELEALYKAKDIETLRTVLDGRSYTDVWDELTLRGATLARAMGKLQAEWNALGAGTQAAERWATWDEAARRAFIASRIERVDLVPSPGIGPLRPLQPGELAILWKSAPSEYRDADEVDPAQTARELTHG